MTPLYLGKMFDFLSMDTLRLLAMRGFRIVGAARIPGGKEGLVAAINRVRGC